MCGIILVQNKNGKPATKAVARRYNAQRARGTEGFGVVAFENGKLIKYLRTEGEKEMEKAMGSMSAPLMLFHHRTPTSTINVPEAAHPIKVSSPNLMSDYYVVHNGIITNADELKAEHEKRGFKYTTTIKTQWITTGKTYEAYEFNDSETLAIELALLIEGQSEKLKCEGDYAFIAAQTSKGGNLTRIYYGTNGGSPLTITEDNNIFALQSIGGKKDVEAGTLWSYDARKMKSIALETNIGSVMVHNTSYGYSYSGNQTNLFEYEYEAREEIGEIDSELEMLEADYQEALQEARKTAYWGDVELVRQQMRQLQEEKEKIQLTYAL